MIVDLDYFKKLKDIIDINSSRDFDMTMNILYIDLHESLQSIKNTEEYKKSITDKFNGSLIPLKDKDMNKIIEFFQDNPIDLYNMILDTAVHIKNSCVYKQIHISDIGKVIYNKLKSECKNNIKIITDDFNSKYENGYFNKERV